MEHLALDEAAFSFHRAISPWQALFLRNAMSDSRLRARRHFRLPFLKELNHSWPTFVDAARIDEWAQLAIRTRRLVLSAAPRLLPQSARELGALFGYAPDRAERIARLVPLIPQRSEAFTSRGDFLLSPTGWRCCEFNFGDVGGWEVGAVTALVMHSPLVAEFITRNHLTIRTRDPLSAVAEHVLKMARRSGPVDTCNLAYLCSEETSDEKFEQFKLQEDYANSVYEPAIRAQGCTGTVLMGRAAEVEYRGDEAWLRGKRIHAVTLRHLKGYLEPGLQRASERGGVVALISPESYMLGDKVLLALVSEAADAGHLAEGDRELIPWTRRAIAARVTFRGREHWLPDLLLERKEEFVLKPGEAFGGQGVVIGRNATAADWEATVATALDAANWVAQEAIGGAPLWYQAGEDGIGPYSINFGPFVFGSDYAGAFLRLAPLSRPDDLKVVSNATGALCGGLLEVVDAEHLADAPVKRAG